MIGHIRQVCWFDVDLFGVSCEHSFPEWLRSPGGCLCSRCWIFSVNSISAPTCINQPRPTLTLASLSVRCSLLLFLPPSLLQHNLVHLACETDSSLTACVCLSVCGSIYFHLPVIASFLSLIDFVDHFCFRLLFKQLTVPKGPVNLFLFSPNEAVPLSVFNNTDWIIGERQNRLRLMSSSLLTRKHLEDFGKCDRRSEFI